MKKVLVIIPTYNEADNIDHVIEAIMQIAKPMRSYDWTILVVDDNSPDGTAKHVRSLQKQHSNTRLLIGKKAGLGKAYIHGLRYAMQRLKFDICILMDGDMSHNPKDIPALLKLIDQGADYVIGSRYASGGSIPGSRSLVRIINSRVANLVARKLVGINDQVSDLTGGFKAMKRQALDQINLGELNARGYIFQVSLLHAFIRQGFSVQEVPITFMSRNHGHSKLKLRDIIEFLYQAYKLNPEAPIQRFVRFGFVGACGSIVNLIILTGLVRVLHFNALIAVAIAIEISILFNFFLNHFYTFRGYGSYSLQDRKEPLRALLNKMGIYNLGALGGAAISFTMFTFLYKELAIEYVLADIIAIVVAMSWNYFVSTRFVWKAIDEETS